MGSALKSCFTHRQTLPRAKVLHSKWEAEVDNRLETLRAKQQGEGHDLTQHQAHALAGEWYRWYVGLHHGNPGQARTLAKHNEILIDWLEGVAGG